MDAREYCQRQVATAAPSVDPAVLRSIEDHIRSDATREMGGVLVGTLDDGVEVDAVIPALEAPGPSENISFTHKVWDEVQQKVDREHPDKQIVGWYRSNPGVGAEVSEYDRFIQQRFFDDPAMVALLIDSESGEAGWFGWEGSELAQIPVVEEPLVEEPLIEEPVVDEPVAEEPVVEEPVRKAAPVVAPAAAPARDRRGLALVAALAV